jgi:ATP-dependent DNA helicase PIF1
VSQKFNLTCPLCEFLDDDSAPSRAFYIDGPAGTGKTFLYKTLLAKFRMEGKIALATASSGIAAILLPGGRTAHSRFKYPQKILPNSTCNIGYRTHLAELLRAAALIVYDEAPMHHRYFIEALDRTLRDLMKVDKPFGGKLIVFGGDFRQCAPVVRNGSEADIINGCLKKSPLWRDIETLSLAINMRLHDSHDNIFYHNFLMNVGGNNFIRTTNENQVTLPERICVRDEDELIGHVFPNLSENFTNPSYFSERCIVCPKHKECQDVNSKLLERTPGQVLSFFSHDVLIDTDNPGQYPIDLLHTLEPASYPPHELKLKLFCPIILLRNLAPQEGLCNGTRLICLGIHDNLLRAVIATGSFAGKIVHIPRITLHPNDDEPIRFKRSQFPVKLAYAMTINKCQGQTLTYVGVHLSVDTFAHGQLYVALSRVTSIENIKVLPPNAPLNVVNLIVYDEFIR